MMNKSSRPAHSSRRLKHVDGPKGVACSQDGDRCWYANDDTGEVCQVEIHDDHHDVFLVEPLDMETGEILTFLNNKGVQVFYPPPGFPCIKGKLCPKTGSPVLLAADNKGQKIVAIDTDTWDAIVLHQWPVNNTDQCNMNIEHMTVSYHPYPVVFANSYLRIERVSLETGESWSIAQNNCGEPWSIAKKQMHHGMTVSGEHLYVANDECCVWRYRILDSKAGEYIDYSNPTTCQLFMRT
jgi:hypothetical protein